MRTDTPKTIYLTDYKPYPFKVESLDLNFDIHDGHTIVTAKSKFERINPEAKEVFLNGEDLELLSVKIDGQEIDDYSVNETALRVPCPGDKFHLEITTKIIPEQNTRLEGLYKSGDTYCTQCEAEGFRRITYYPDRPDVLTVFTVRVEADEQHKILLSNGNRMEDGPCDDGRHFVTWHDPFPKPCYLFALVAGDLTHIHDIFTTQSGRNVDLYIYVRPGDEGQCDHAMQSLKRAMKWDEDVYGLEYELDLFNIVAVSDFNMGAMENTSLNIFNTALVLAQEETATDSDFMRVESVIAHEYFHNWSGNRVTCRDWFQLSLKEGLTVFRDQEFSADMHSRTVQRIDDVTQLRRLQFPEDAGPLAHPIRPDQYIEINNFYTMTVYEKGAEVIRMLRTILGPEKYRAGTDLYFSRHDGAAVTCEDFVDCMEEASGINLSQFRLWYSTAGTPEVDFQDDYKDGTYTITIAQSHETPLHIPVQVGLGDEEHMLHLTEKEQSFEFVLPEKPVPSILRGFSAPVKLKHNLSNDDLIHLMLHDSDGFNRWESGQQLYLRALNEGADIEIGDIIGQLLDDADDQALLARMLTVPSISLIGQERDVVDPDDIDDARKALLRAIEDTQGDKLRALYDSLPGKTMQERALRNTCLSLLDDEQLARAHYDAASNMTDRVAALSLIAEKEDRSAFDDFYERFKDYPLVVDKYFAMQAAANRKDIIQILNTLRQHSDFNIKNPNRVRSLYSAFAMNNPVGFHAVDGSGYEFLTAAIIELNTINPQIAARLLTPMREWRRYTADRQEKMKAALDRILATPDLSPDVFEIASKSLNA